jgi:hypothetical protein
MFRILKHMLTLSANDCKAGKGKNYEGALREWAIIHAEK